MQDRPDLAAAEGLGQLAGAWQQTEQHWHDDVARRFGTHHVTPLLSEALLSLTTETGNGRLFFGPNRFRSHPAEGVNP